jgi:hypothetical protein
MAFLQAISLKMPVKSFQAIVRRKKRISTCYCTGNMLQNACKQFEFLSNNFSVQKDVFLLAVLQAFCLKMSVKILNFWQTILRRKIRMSPCFYTSKKPQNACEKLNSYQTLILSYSAKNTRFYMQYASKCL